MTVRLPIRVAHDLVCDKTAEGFISGNNLLQIYAVKVVDPPSRMYPVSLFAIVIEGSVPGNLNTLTYAHRA